MTMSIRASGLSGAELGRTTSRHTKHPCCSAQSLRTAHAALCLLSSHPPTAQDLACWPLASN